MHGVRFFCDMAGLRRPVLSSARGKTALEARGQVGGAMRGNDFKRWRKGLELSQKEAADVLGLKRRVVQYYEKGERDGKPVKIPRTVRLACYAILSGVTDYQGPDKDKKADRDKKADKERKKDKKKKRK
jgi:transcriptional regulator with XRE-family HTH domain